jgi:hypothetical protein
MTAPRTVTRVRIAPTRIPVDIRPRLARLAQRGYQVCSKAGAPLQAEAFDMLGIALLDIAALELRAEGAEARARRAERDLAAAQAKIRALEQDIAERVRAEFEESTRTADLNPLAEACR